MEDESEDVLDVMKYPKRWQEGWLKGGKNQELDPWLN